MPEIEPKIRRFRQRGHAFNKRVAARARHVTQPEQIASRIAGEIEELREDNPQAKVVLALGVEESAAQQTLTEAGIQNDNIVLFNPGRVTRAIVRSSKAIHGTLAAEKTFSEVIGQVDIAVFDIDLIEGDRTVRETHYRAERLAKEGQLEIVYRDAEAVA